MYGSFILSIKRGLNTPTLLGIFSGVTTFCLDMVYRGGWTSKSLLVYLINVSTIKQISDRNVVLSYSRAFLDCLWACLAGTKGAKDDNVRSACTRGIYLVEAPCVEGAYFIGVTYA